MTEQPRHSFTFEPAADHGLAPVERFRSVRREPGFFTFVSHAVFGTLLRTYFILYHRLRIQGKENLPRKTPFVVISNHTSHLDALTLAAALPLASRVHAYPVAAGDVFFETIASSVLTAAFLNALPLWRKKATAHALDELRDRLARGHSGYILFPEGARSRDGKMLPFKAGLGMLIAGTDVPVIPCYISGAFEACPPDKSLPRPRTIHISVGKPMVFKDKSSDKVGWLAVAEETQAAVVALGGGNGAVMAAPESGERAELY